MSDPNKYNETMVDDCGVEHHIDDFRPDEDDNLQEGQCICGAFECSDEYAHWTSGWQMLEFIGLCTCIYLAIKLFPSAVKFTIKVAVALLLVLMLFLALQVAYHWWLVNVYMMGLIA